MTDTPESFNLPTVTDDARTEARLCTVQAVYQHRLTEDSGTQVVQSFLTGPVKARQADKTLFKALFEATLADQSRYETLVSGFLKEGWTLEKLDSTLQALLLVATAELSTQADTETKVVLSEYIALARAFFDDKQSAFVNGILDKIAQAVR